MRAVRIRFKKEGRAKYISHLDMNRCFTRAVRRSRLDVWYTEGFNPHPYLNFLTPLSLGQESDCEPLDIRLEGDITNEQAFRMLSETNLPEGITVLSVDDPQDPAASIAFARYSVELEFNDEESAAKFAKVSKELISVGELTAEKQCKKGGRKITKTINLCNDINSFDIISNGCTANAECTLTSGISGGLNPALLFSALFQASGIGADYLLIRRKKLLKADMTEFK